MVLGPATLHPPKGGLWRIGRGADPLVGRAPEPATMETSRSGNRFDLVSGAAAVLYFGTSLEVCFGETLARFRPSAHLIAVIGHEWQKLGFMEVGAVPADWRFRRTAVRVIVPARANFVDVESPRTHQYLRSTLALGLSSLGHDDLDVAVIRGPDRRVTRLVSGWAYQATLSDGDPTRRYAGVRYLSRLSNDWECWAVFDDTDLEVVENRPITLDMPELQAVAELFGLQVF